MTNFSDISTQLSQSSLVHHQIKTLEELEAEVLFSIACNKDQIFRSKYELFQKNKTIRINVIANNTNFGCVSSNISGREINVISTEMIKNDINIVGLTKQLENSLVVTTSNLFAEIGAARFGVIYERLPSTIFVIHDYDNHHWISNNIQAAISSDVYAPAHQSDNLMASRVNPNILGGIPCGSNQWSMNFINTFGKDNLLRKRSQMPLGKYYYYEKFSHRNKTISTLSQNYPEIGFIKQDFHTLSPMEKWLEWSGHTLHWVAPVLNDLPIRFFDALITGGIPIVPSGLKPYIDSLQIPDKFYATYGPLDVLSPRDLLAAQNERFDQLGEAGVLERHQFAFEHFHIDVIAEKLITKSLNIYGLP